jgi:uncharacterized Fe-S center protein
MTRVYFTRTFDTEAIRCLFKSALEDMVRRIDDSDKVAVKLHFGEEGNTRYVKPYQIKPITDELIRLTANCFLTDANTLYTGMRHNGHDHRRIAEHHGFTTLGLLVIIADDGKDEKVIDIQGNIFKKVKIGRAIAEADAVVAVSHFKGHVMFSFGGAIKNLGMGSGSRAGKLEMHSKVRPSVNRRCNGCGSCVENCRADAISIVNDKAVIDHGICEGCAYCIAICPSEAISGPWGGATNREVQNRCSEYALGTVKDKKLVCINFINNITRDCDCMADTQIIGSDVGITASIDPLSCDKAAYDLVMQKHNGRDIFKSATGVDGTSIFSYAEKIGLGRAAYDLVSID